jgi:hypothetical protein
VLATVLLMLVSGVAAGGQDPATDGAFITMESIPSPPDRPQRPLVPAKAKDPRFRLRVQMETGSFRYAGNHAYKGTGNFTLQTANKQYDFRYTCAYSFDPMNQSYHARWIVRDRKLEILMSKPGSASVKRCRLTTEPAPL